jgi:hypothetical protein
MSAVYVWVVTDAQNRTLVHRADRYQALRNLRHFRDTNTLCALILETTQHAANGWQLASTERTIVGINDPLPEPMQ